MPTSIDDLRKAIAEYLPDNRDEARDYLTKVGKQETKNAHVWWILATEIYRNDTEVDLVRKSLGSHPEFRVNEK